MTRVVDSSAWIEWAANGAISLKLESEIPAQSDCVVPTIVQYEIAKWMVREVGEEKAGDFIAYTRECIVVELDTRIALWAADLSRRHKLSTADAIVYATALDNEADLLTCDAHFKGLPHVVYLANLEN